MQCVCKMNRIKFIAKHMMQIVAQQLIATQETLGYVLGEWQIGDSRGGQTTPLIPPRNTWEEAQWDEDNKDS